MKAKEITWRTFDSFLSPQGNVICPEDRLIALKPKWPKRPIARIFRRIFRDGMDSNFADWFATEAIFPTIPESLGRRFVGYGLTAGANTDATILGRTYPIPENVWQIRPSVSIKPLSSSDLVCILRSSSLVTHFGRMGDFLTCFMNDRYGYLAFVQVSLKQMLVSAFPVNPANHRIDHNRVVRANSVVLTPGPPIV